MRIDDNYITRKLQDLAAGDAFEKMRRLYIATDILNPAERVGVDLENGSVHIFDATTEVYCRGDLEITQKH